jgi:hypothetical protein
VPDEQDKAESVDADRIGPDERGDDEELANYPPDRLLGANQYGVVPSEEEVDEPLEERVSREEPEPLIEALEHQGRLDVNELERDAPLGGTLVEPLEAPDDPVLDAELVPQEDLSPEEAAMHLESDDAAMQ